jgi:hypothetical protein
VPTRTCVLSTVLSFAASRFAYLSTLSAARARRQYHWRAACEDAAGGATAWGSCDASAVGPATRDPRFILLPLAPSFINMPSAHRERRQYHWRAAVRVR